MQLNGATMVSRAPGAVFEEVDGRVLVLDPDQERYVRLNATGTVVWQELDDATRIDVLGERLASAANIDAGRALVDVITFVESLRERGLLHCATI